MNANGFVLGGEQSGHVIMSEFANTGDGVLTALHVAARWRPRDAPPLSWPQS
jgi:phosphoglucosamine mutase